MTHLSLQSDVLFGSLVATYGNHVIHELPYSRANLQQFWLKVKHHKNIFNTELRGDFEKFVSLFIEQHGEELVPRGLIWVVDDFAAMMYLTHISEHEATAHISLMDREARDPEIAKELMRYVFRTFKFHRLNAEVPVYVVGWFFDYVKSVGFIEEGNRRKCYWFDNKWFDARIYGLLASEVLGVETIALGIR